MRPIIVSLLLASTPGLLLAQHREQSLEREIAAIRAVDDHTHASRAFSPGDTIDLDSDALPCPTASAPRSRLPIE